MAAQAGGVASTGGGLGGVGAVGETLVPQGPQVRRVLSRVCAGAHAGVSRLWCTRARFRPCVRPCMRAFMGASVCGCARVCVHARCMRACMHACVRVCVCMRVYACMHARAHACPGCAHRHLHTKRHSHIAISPSPSCHPTSDWPSAVGFVVGAGARQRVAALCLACAPRTGASLDIDTHHTHGECSGAVLRGATLALARKP